MSHTNPMLRHPAIGLLPRGVFLLTAAHEGKRAGVIVHSVQVCGGEPPLLCITMRKGHWVETLIRDSHAFAVCIIDPADRLIERKFVEAGMPRESGDPFDCLPLDRLTTGAPIVRRSVGAFDCLVARHLDVDTDHGLYVGTVVASRVYQSQTQSQSMRSGPDSLSA